jgi:cytosine/adenosine deaminase-related metal-dependent hydrolase
MAERTGAAGGLHTHLLESPAQRQYLDSWLGRSVVTVLDTLGLLGPATSLAHAVHIRPAEIELLAQRGAQVVTNPGSNLRLGNGIAPVAALLDAGVPVAVGTDDMAAGDDDDLFAEGRLMALLQRPRGRWLAAAQVLSMLTSAGAGAALFGALTGRLEPGRRADLVLLATGRLDEPGTGPPASDLELVVARAAARDVRTVLIDGSVRYHEGRHTWVDRAEVVSALRDVVRAQTGADGHRQAVRLSEQLASWHDGFAQTQEAAR